jgi:hypothetical protein
VISSDATPRIAPWRERVRVIIFEADTPAGKASLLVVIVCSVLAVMLDSVASIRQHFRQEIVTCRL